MRGIPFRRRFVIFYVDPKTQEIEVFSPDRVILDVSALRYMLALFRQEHPTAKEVWYDDCRSFKPKFPANDDRPVGKGSG